MFCVSFKLKPFPDRTFSNSLATTEALQRFYYTTYNRRNEWFPTFTKIEQHFNTFKYMQFSLFNNSFTSQYKGSCKHTQIRIYLFLITVSRNYEQDVLYRAKYHQWKWICMQVIYSVVCKQLISNQFWIVFPLVKLQKK